MRGRCEGGRISAQKTCRSFQKGCSDDPQLAAFEVRYGRLRPGLEHELLLQLELQHGVPPVRPLVDLLHPRGDELHPMTDMEARPFLAGAEPVLDDPGAA